MKIVLAALNASYIHTPLALYALKAYCTGFQEQISIESFTINHTDGFILRRLFLSRPDIVGFSCAVWNIEKTLRIAADLKKLLPSIVIILGGPEVAADFDAYLLTGPADVIIPGEGEKPFAALLARYAEVENIADKPSYQAYQNSWGNHPDFRAVSLNGLRGVAWADNNRVYYEPPETPLLLNELPFPYNVDLVEQEHKLIYYEASRGCPYRCGYCLSATDRGIRLRPLEDVRRHLQIFINARVQRVKFTDRTFNAHADFAMDIWRFLMESDNGFTNFHFEITADRLQEEALQLLGRARPGLFQFEIGIQTINPEALSAVDRVTDLPRLFKNITRLRASDNIHLHLDLIAGLPGESLSSFQASFNAAYHTQPHQLQLGFLKLLKGTPLHAKAGELGLVYAQAPPYEILFTRDLSYAELLILKAVEEMVEIFYNTGKFTVTLRYLARWFSTSYDMYKKLSDFWLANHHHEAPHGKMRLYEILFAFCETLDTTPAERDIFCDLLRFDLLVNENEKSLPGWLAGDLPEADRQRIRVYKSSNWLHKSNNRNQSDDKSSDKAYDRTMRIERFRTDILAWLQNEETTPAIRIHFLLFEYPEPGRQPPFRISQWVKEVLL